MINAKVITDSISTHTGQRITTFELEYPRFIHAELMTHRMFSRNSASSRAIPINKMIELIEQSPAMPIHWGKNQSGMQAKVELSQVAIDYCKSVWQSAMRNAISHVKNMADYGLHKQVANRILEPYQMIKVIVTATDYANWFNLRLHPDAQPEIHELAKVMYEALALSEPMELSHGEWHLPYIEREREEQGGIKYFVYNQDEDPTSEAYGHQYYVPLTLEQAQKISCSCCAQVSYRKSDTSIEKAITIYDKLVNSKPVHASAFEHCATPSTGVYFEYGMADFTALDKGVTHININMEPCSGNFTNWIQYRQLIPNHDCKEFGLESL